MLPKKKKVLDILIFVVCVCFALGFAFNTAVNPQTWGGSSHFLAGLHVTGFSVTTSSGNACDSKAASVDSLPRGFFVLGG